MTPEIQLEYKRKSKTNRTRLFRSGRKTDMSPKPPPDLDLFNLQFHESDDNNMEMRHMKNESSVFQSHYIGIIKQYSTFLRHC